MDAILEAIECKASSSIAQHDSQLNAALSGGKVSDPVSALTSSYLLFNSIIIHVS